MNCPTSPPNFKFLLLLLGAMLPVLASGQDLSVYPGDATNNGVVNNLDLLAIGLGYNFNGPARDSVIGNNLAFGPFNAFHWDLQLPGGLNAAYADCDGNGQVNFNDAIPIFTNYGLRHQDSTTHEDTFVAGLPGVDPVLGFDESAAPNLLMPGDAFSLPITLGTASLPAEDVYGLAFSVFTTPQFHPVKSFDFTQSSWANDDGDRVFMYKNVSPLRSDIAWTRTDRNQRNGHGPIGVADLIIIVDVIDKAAPIRVWTDSIRMIDKYGNVSTVAGDTVTFNWHPNAFPAATHENETPQISVLPNPVKDWLQIQCSEKMEEVTLYDLLGKPAYHSTVSNLGMLNLHLPDLPSGCYTLAVHTTRGQIRRKVMVQ